MGITLLGGGIARYDGQGADRLDLAVVESRKTLGIEGDDVCQRVIRQQAPQNAEIPFQQHIVRVEEADIASFGMGNAAVACLAQPLVLLTQNTDPQFVLRIAAQHLFGNADSAIRTAVIHDDHFRPVRQLLQH
ncbi:hypothetical protein D3C80_1423920 [compost metagenome]